MGSSWWLARMSSPDFFTQIPGIKTKSVRWRHRSRGLHTWLGFNTFILVFQWHREQTSIPWKNIFPKQRHCVEKQHGFEILSFLLHVSSRDLRSLRVCSHWLSQSALSINVPEADSFQELLKSYQPGPVTRVACTGTNRFGVVIG